MQDSRTDYETKKILQYQPMVRSIAFRFRQIDPCFQGEDVRAIANEKLLLAIRSFDPSIGTDEKGYFYDRVFKGVADAFRDAYGRTESQRRRRFALRHTSIDEPMFINKEEYGTIAQSSIVSDDGELARTMGENDDHLIRINKFLSRANRLPRRDVLMVRMRAQGLKLKQIAYVFQLTEARISQILSSAKRVLAEDITELKDEK